MFAAAAVVAAAADAVAGKCSQTHNNKQDAREYVCVCVCPCAGAAFCCCVCVCVRAVCYSVRKIRSLLLILFQSDLRMGMRESA